MPKFSRSFIGRRKKQRRKLPAVVGITGSLAGGKTTVAGIFKKNGAGVIDADKIAHSLLVKGSPVYKKTVLKFGPIILNRDKSINKPGLADAVFGSKRRLSSYLKIIHPEIKKTIRQKIRQKRKAGGRYKIIVLDAPLLIEAGMLSDIDKLIVVRINKANQLKRIKAKFGRNEDILKRLKFQIPLSQKSKLADYIIDNNNPLKETEKQVKKIWEDLTRG
ncbi:MAG: dephospho-CoA kinase [Candidatus Omnitrophica bacterium CG11_big_fil_rev_8_21_14_0_20_42_13]|uniref:Dephospho-CoA kinase n=1 Tax=Candidatus Ghiorseimicrobium undicola TaxID=1974746 RepID=A0A2H0LWX3_9BACT|nr:MAG: dephospho-CoA kinase [Candidatus Omnitrophica bacterium CG11_big_fil_rev_8_21_14_0_20_42_13]